MPAESPQDAVSGHQADAPEPADPTAQDDECCASCTFPARVVIQAIGGTQTPPLCLRCALDTLHELLRLGEQEVTIDKVIP